MTKARLTKEPGLAFFIREMRNQVRFFMNVEDEAAFIRAVVAEPNTVLVDGPTWSTSEVPLLDPADLGGHHCLLIWNRREVRKLNAKPLETRWEVAHEENLTIQFLRSQSWDNRILCEGRIAIATTWARAAPLERRYRKLRKWIQTMFQNEVVCWWQPDAPRTAKNPSVPDKALWVGPGALHWLLSKPAHKFKQDRFSPTEAILADEARKK